MMKAFKETVQQTLGHAPQEIIADGNIHRFSTSEKRGDKSGWYVFYDNDELKGAAFGDWHTGSTCTWCSKQDNEFTPAERKAWAQRMEQARQQRTKVQAKEQQEAKQEAVKIWTNATKAPDNHPYIERKKIKPLLVRQCNRFGDLCLIVPITIKGELTSLQFIKPDGGKRFLTGGEIKGGSFVLGQPDQKLYVAEGYATAATIHEATGEAVAVVFNCGNMMAACKALAQQFHGINLVICADNDHKSEENIGLKKAKEVSEKLTYRIVYPQGIEGSDFNDMAAEGGLDAVRHALKVKDDNKPWLGHGSPWGYSCNKSGVSVCGGDSADDERITHAPCWVSALSRDGVQGYGLNWGRLVHWLDHDGFERKRAIPASYFHKESSDVVCMLADEGFPIIHGKEKRLISYLSAFTPKARLLSAPATGWNGQAFVLPTETINEPEGERVVYQPVENEAIGKAIHGKGTLDQWRDHVAGGTDSPVVRFAIAAALAAPMRFHADVDAGGFHFYGVTSKGKTTTLQAASSVWGNGADPSMVGGADVYLQRWNATKNGLEAMASGFNDLPFCIDEIGESESKDFGGIIYNLMSGTGKRRMTKSISSRATKAWRILVLSSGELPVHEYIEEKGGKVRAGQLVRLVDIPAVDLFPSAKEADAMKKACADYFGTAGPAFLAREAIVERFKVAWKAFCFDQVGITTTAPAGRALRRFCLVACVGELAIQTGILPWEEGAAIQAAKHAFELWQGSSSASTTGERGVEKIRAFILKYDSRFEREKAKVNPMPYEREGFYKDKHYNFLPESFNKACGGEDAREVKAALLDLGLLKVAIKGKFYNRMHSAEAGKRIQVISVNDDILEGGEA